MSNKNKPKDAGAPKVNVLGGVGNALGQNVGAQSEKDDESKVKGHPLKKSHFPSPVVCGVCKKNIWGVGKQGYKCSKCDLTVHKKCIDDLTHECPSADSPPVGRAQSKISGDFTGLAAKSQPALVIDESKLVPTFGSKLDALMGFETIYNPSATMPSVVEKSLHFLMQNGLSVEGIFRIPGGSGKMNSIIEKFNKGQGLQIDFRKEQCSEADVSSVLKKYFRDLPEPLFTNAMQAQFQELQGVERYADRNPRFLELFKQLPKVNQMVAKEFLFFLYQVSTNSHMNMMNTDNLATIFGTMAGVFFSFDHGHDLVMYMIDEYPTLFEADDIAKANEPLFRRRLVGHLRSVITLIPFEGMMFSFDSNGMVRWWKEQEMKPVSHLNGGAKLFSNPILVGDWLWAVTPQEVIMWNARTLIEKGNVPDAKKTLPIRGELTGTLVGDNVWLAGEKLLVVDPEGQTVRDLTDYTNDMTMCMDKAGAYVWTWRSKVIHVYNPDTFEKVAEIKDVCNSKAIFFAAIEGNIWVACDDASILVISETDFSLVTKLTQHKGCVYHIAAVGPVVLSCAWDKTIRIWDPISFSPLGTLDNIHTDAISYLMPRARPNDNSFELWTASWDRSINVSYIPASYLSQFRSGLSSSNDQPGSSGPVVVLPPIPLRAPSNPAFVSAQISPGRMPPPPQYLPGPPQGLPPPPQNLPPPPQIGAERPVSPTPTPTPTGVQVLPPLPNSNTVPNLLPRPPVRPKGPGMPKGGDHILKSKSAASVFGEQREQLVANAKIAPGPGLKKAPPALVPRAQTSAGGVKAPSPRSSGQMGQLNATLGNLCNEVSNIQQQRDALDQEIQEHINSLHQEIESMSKGGSSENWISKKAKLEDLHQQELDLTNKYAEASKSLAETRQLIRLAELQQLLEQIETKDNLSETPRY